jgi:hypothetical protein
MCNQTPNQISVANGFFGDYDGIGCNWFHDSYGHEDVEWKAWYNINPGQCATTFSGCYTSGDMLFFAEDFSNGDFWAGNGKNGWWAPIYNSFHGTECCYESTASPNATYGQTWPGLDTCAPGQYPDAVISFGPRYAGLTRYSICAQDKTITFTE